MPEKETMMNYGASIGASKWRRTELPTFMGSEVEVFSGTFYGPDDEVSWNEVRREEIIAQTGCDPWTKDSKGRPKQVPGVVADEFYINETLEDFRIQEFNRIRYGYWFYNKGRPIFITGFHYFYLNWWELNTGYPDFRDTDRQLFFFWEYVRTDKNCFGLLEITKRGQGKSYRMGSVAYLQTILYLKSHVGIQSKNDTDSEDFFLKKVVEPYKSLPEFLIPINDHGTEPKSTMNFFPPAERGIGASFKQKKTDALRSVMDFRPAGDKAYDSTTLKFLVQDEIAKIEKKSGNAEKRLATVRECVHRDMKMVGKLWLSSTVEEMEKGGQQAKNIWYDSNLDDLTENGRTVSGLYRYFSSALESSYFDAWGFPLVAKAKKFHDGERDKKEGDSVSYIGYVQKNPYNIEEAFMTLGGGCIYNAKILQARQRFLQEFRMTIKGDFEWLHGKWDTKVIWVPNELNGKWELSWNFEKVRDSNKITTMVDGMGHKTFAPRNDGAFASALDPVSHKQTVDLRRSNAAIAVIRKFHPFIDTDQSDTWIADYVARHDNPNDDYENAIKACVYFGMSILIENNKASAIDYFYQRGYADFVMTRPAQTTTSKAQETDGIPSTRPMIEYYIGKGRTHINEHGYKCNHLRIVRDFLDFDPMKPTKYDLGVASQLSLVAAEKFDIMHDKYNDDKYEMDEIFA